MVLCYVVIFGGPAHSPDWMGVHVLQENISCCTSRSGKVFGLEKLGTFLAIFSKNSLTWFAAMLNG
jgi:hypothetical protein